ncbi:MAG: VOC family protein [Planctomycetota bacterium]
MRLKRLIPMLNVSDIERSLAFYRDALGFEVVSDLKAVKEWEWALIRSGETELMLTQSDCDLGLYKGPEPEKDGSWPALYYFYPEDVAALHAHVVERGYRPTELDVTFYGMREFGLRDPDGHALAFGQDAGESAPKDA